MEEKVLNDNKTFEDCRKDYTYYNIFIKILTGEKFPIYIITPENNKIKLLVDLYDAIREIIEKEEKAEKRDYNMQFLLIIKNYIKNKKY